jgi:hypothetical protein
MRETYNKLTTMQASPPPHTLDWLDLALPIEDADQLQPGEMFHMGFGFPRGQEFHTKDEHGRLITSIDGHRAYLLIIDRKTRYIWVLLTKNKLPSCEYVKTFLNMQGKHTGRRIIHTDKGGELWGFLQFHNTVPAQYILEPTAPGVPFQKAWRNDQTRH